MKNPSELWSQHTVEEQILMLQNPPVLPVVGPWAKRRYTDGVERRGYGSDCYGVSVEPHITAYPGGSLVYKVNAPNAHKMKAKADTLEEAMKLADEYLVKYYRETYQLEVIFLEKDLKP